MWKLIPNPKHNTNHHPCSLSLPAGFWNSNEVKVQRGFYCTYDPFTRSDVRCELCIPGGVVCGALDSKGVVQEVTPALWRNVQVAGFLRAELYDPELVSFGNAVMR